VVGVAAVLVVILLPNRAAPHPVAEDTTAPAVAPGRGVGSGVAG
jgi:hypothetical protein